jgi:hypothetical protein
METGTTLVSQVEGLRLRLKELEEKALLVESQRREELGGILDQIEVVNREIARCEN